MGRENELVEFCSQLKFDSVGAGTVEHTKIVFLDTIGTIIGGFHHYPKYNKWAQEMARTATGNATILGIGRDVEEGYAALANGTAGPSLELDEGNKYCAGHPAIHVVPAVLAMAETEKTSGKEVITAIVAGYEIASRIGRAVTPLRPAFHPHGTWGVVGAAVACARLLHYDPLQTYQAAVIAANYSLNAFFDTALEGATVRDTYCGVANFLGILSVRLARHGFTGLRQGIERQFAHLGENGFDDACLVDSLGQRLEITTNYFKMHVGCRSTHGALDALNRIIVQHGPIGPEEIAAVEVSTYASAAKLSNPHPHNALQARFSLPYAVAARLFYRSSGVDAFAAEAITPDVLDLARKVTVSENAQFSSQVPYKRSTQVIVRLRTGEKASAMAEIPEGDCDRPFSPQAIKKKFSALAIPHLGEDKVARILDAIESMETLENLTPLTSLLV